MVRSWLFVPGDSERKLEKGREIGADALILDLEDAVSNDRQDIARAMVCAYLKAGADRSRQQLWVRINPLDSELSLPDLAAVMPGAPDGICLPKVYSAAEVNKLWDYLSALEAREGLTPGSTSILCVATETAETLGFPIPAQRKALRGAVQIETQDHDGPPGGVRPEVPRGKRSPDQVLLHHRVGLLAFSATLPVPLLPKMLNPRNVFLERTV